MVVVAKETKRARFSESSTDPKRSTPRRRLQPPQRLPRVEDFMDLEASHPYGVLPGGNLFVAGSSSGGSSNVFSNVLDGEVCHTILSFCDGPDLARLAQTCRFMYAVSHQLELWRDLVLWYLNENMKQNKQPNVLLDLQPSWKDTYVHLVMQSRGVEMTMKPHVPMAVPGVYSDYFYRLHSCRTFCIPQSWFRQPEDNKNGTSRFSVPCISAAEMTTELFYQDFERNNRPVVVSQAASTWKATTLWSTEYLREQTLGRDFRATSGAAPLSAQFSFEAYQKYCHWEHLEEAPLYLFDRTALKPNSLLWKDFHVNLQETCPYWDREVSPQHDLFSLLGEGRRPDHTWWIVGPKRSGSVFHMDPNATHAWNAAIRGRKRWIFYPPGQPPPGVHPSVDADQVALPLTVGEWLFQFWPQHVERMRHSPPDQQPLECTAFPGDVMFVPHGWWHMVINLDEGMNLAITHNYVSHSNLPNVLKFMDQKEDQISGCRDRKESIKPRQLYGAFCDVLRDHHPLWLQEALTVPEWTCHAWSNRQESMTRSATSKKPTLGTKKGNSEGAETLEDGQDVKTSRNIMAIAKSGEEDKKEQAVGGCGFSFSFL